MKLFRKRSQPAPKLANPVKIALLEHELFGIEPEPNSAAALVLQLRRVAGAGVSVHSFGTPEFGNGTSSARRLWLRDDAPRN